MKKYLKFIIPAVILMICGISATVYNIIYHSSFCTFKRFFDSDNAVEARQVALENKDDERFMSRAEELISDYYDKQKEKYIVHEIGYQEAVSRINSYSSVYSGSDVTDILEKIENSRADFDRGRQYQEHKEYRAAIESYELVSEEDEEHFILAADNIAECKDGIVEETLSECDELLGKDDYKKAYEVLTKLENTYVTDKITSKLTDVKKAYSQNIKSSVGEYIVKNNPLGALRYISYYKIDEIKDKEIDDLYSRTQDQYVESVLTQSDKLLKDKKIDKCIKYLSSAIDNCNKYNIQADSIETSLRDAVNIFTAETITKADKQASAGNYNSAIAIIEDAQKVYNHLEFLRKIEDYRNQRDKEVISTYKSVIGYSYDYIEDKYRIKAKGVGDVDYAHATSRNLEPFITLKGDKVSFGVIIEYLYKSQEYNYFKTDKLIVQCDDKQYTFDIEYDNAYDDSRYIYPYRYECEWTILMHLDHFSYDGSDVIFDMVDFSKDIINANSITLRFYDGGKKRDFYVPKNEQTEFKNLWNLYTMLKDNPSAIEYII